jgi:hypothetical protein
MDTMEANQMGQFQVGIEASPVSAVTYAPAYRLFSVQAVTIAALFGGPVAGSILMAVNYSRLGKKGQAALTFIVGFVVTAIAIFIGYAIPANGTYPIALGLLILTRFAATSMQGKAIERHVSLGGRLGSKWLAFGLGVAILCVIFLAIFVPAYMSSAHSKVIIGSKDEVFYTGSATRQEAQSLGDALKKGSYFVDRGTSVFLDKGANGTTISLVVHDGAWDVPGTLATEEEAMREVADSVDGLPIHVRLMNAAQEVKKEGIVGRASLDGKDEVFYFGKATEAEATALIRALQEEKYFSGRGTSVLLSKDEDGTVMSFVVSEGFWDDPAHVTEFEAVVRAVAPSVGGLPVKLRLVNTALDDKKDTVVQ